MKKLIWLTAIIFCCSVCFAQDEENINGFQKSKVFGGGNFGLSFGRYTFVNLSPQVGYRFNKYVAAGLGINLIYASQKDRDIYGNDYSKTSQWITGLNLFGRFYPTQNILLQVQPEANYVFGNIKFYQPTEQTYKMNAEIIPSFLIGGGYAIPSQNGAFVTTVMYDILQRDGSPYGNRPIVNFGYNFNF
jgi:long-subunit fatty acid transport protein